MGHQEHFLSRLERVDGKALKWALRLYNHAKVREFICLALPDPRPERFAIALEAGEEPPYVILTSAGRFVTCLGRGMAPYDLKVIPHRELRGFEARVESILKATEEINARGLIDYGKIEAKLIEVDRLLSRETFLEAALWQPLVLEKTYDEMRRMALALEKRDELMATLPMRRLRGMSERELRLYWRSVCMAGLQAQLMSLDVPMLRQSVPRLAEDPWLLRKAFSHHQALTCAQGIWSAAKIGPPLIPSLKVVINGSVNSREILGCFAGLTAIALRHKKSHAMISKFFEVQSKQSGGERETYYATLGSLYLSLLEESDDARESAVRSGRVGALALGEHFPPESPYNFGGMEPENLEKVPEDLILPAMLYIGGDIFKSEVGFKCVTEGVLLIARANPEDLYFPQTYLDTFNPPPASIRTIKEHIRKRAELKGKPRTAKASATPGRNDPCSCGSGRKYKKCCGRG